jgi:hypothetical protein
MTKVKNKSSKNKYITANEAFRISCLGDDFLQNQNREALFDLIKATAKRGQRRLYLSAFDKRIGIMSEGYVSICTKDFDLIKSLGYSIIETTSVHSVAHVWVGW